ncbi:MAG: threonine ammonia-lyase [Mangrovicoccus sp.]
MTPDAIEAAAERLRGHARVTPLLNNPALDEIAGRPVWVKAECLQHTGAFKYRGARSAISLLSPDILAKGITARSSGNHAQAVARVAREFGTSAVIVMPSDAPKTKIDGTRALGGEIVFYDRATEDRDAISDAVARDRGLHLVLPFDDPDVIAGQGTCGLEIAEQAKAQGISDDAAVMVCCGGGGLTAGVAVALADKAPGMRVYPVEPEGFDDMRRSQLSGKREVNPATTGSICDAVLTPKPGELTFPLIHKHCGLSLVVSDEEALKAMALAFRHLKIVVEPGGAIGLAAALFRPEINPGRTVIAIASGGNVDATVYRGQIFNM